MYEPSLHLHPETWWFFTEDGLIFSYLFGKKLSFFLIIFSDFRAIVFAVFFVWWVLSTMSFPFYLEFLELSLFRLQTQLSFVLLSMMIALAFPKCFFFKNLKTECLAHSAKPYLHVHALFIDVTALATVTPLNCMALSSLPFIIPSRVLIFQIFMSSRVHFTIDVHTPTWKVNSDTGKAWYNIADTVELCLVNCHFEKKLWAELMRMPWEEISVKPQERFPQAYTR